MTNHCYKNKSFKKLIRNYTFQKTSEIIVQNLFKIISWSKNADFTEVVQYGHSFKPSLYYPLYILEYFARYVSPIRKSTSVQFN